MPKQALNNFLAFLVIISALFFAGLVSFALTNHQEDKKPELASKTEDIKQVIVISRNTPSAKPSSYIIKTLSTPTILPSPTAVASSQLVSNLTALVSNNPTATPDPQTNQIDLVINNSPSLNVNVADGANQCDVLTQALNQGKISSLNMQYNSSYNSYAVYQINGVGKENQVWWTYSVNGANPPLGCSLVKAKNKDKVVWTYIGPI
ncbi:DUF4430 domain-containing protein [Candidatus Daviesbacteria bacterium]|nr:DUF4430 domain-containing protein [Candidatus Daviesbacteria bacterium]